MKDTSHLSIINTLEGINLNGCSFDSQEACESLAKLLGNAKKLGLCDLEDQIGERKIRVEVTYSLKNKGTKNQKLDGEISILDEATHSIVLKKKFDMTGRTSEIEFEF